MAFIGPVLFALCLGAAGFLFSKNVRRVRRNILLGKDEDRSDRSSERWQTMLRVAFGQQKMAARPVPFVLHLMVYVGFLVINAEMIEIILDGLSGQHRIMGQALNAIGLGAVYNLITGAAEVFMVLVFVGCAAFLVRRHVVKVPRVSSPELKNWPQLDAGIILWTEIILVIALVIMNGSDRALQLKGDEHYAALGYFPLSNLLVGGFMGIDAGVLSVMERGAWWVHILGILAFLNYIPYSKHFHIMLAFPTTYFSNLKPKGEFALNKAVYEEVKLIMDPNAPQPEPIEGEPAPFGARDVMDLSWKNLMDSYTCTECGRCTSNCPANITGKLLSPRRIMMATRDRLDEVGINIDKNGGKFEPDGKSLLHDYISTEELWACTSCNACTEACPINLDPLSIITQLRQHLALDESKAPEAWNAMFRNVENNQAPWAVPAAQRFAWADDIYVKA